MKGNNELSWCEAQMIEAVGHYLKCVLLTPHEAEKVNVVSVKPTSDPGRSGFRISLEEVSPQEESPDA